MKSQPITTVAGSANSAFRKLQHVVTETDLLDERTCDKFAAWLIPELERLRETYAAFITPDSGRSMR